MEKCSGVDALSARPIEIAFGRTIEAVSPAEAAASAGYLAPGFIDLQVNGFAGVDFNAPTTSHEEIARSIRALFATGVTRFCPTLITGAPEAVTAALRNLAAARERLPEGAAIAGFHMEGPHISPEDGPRGAHPRRWVRRPDLHELHRWQDAARGLIRIVTLSPEWPEASRYIEGAVRDGIVIAIGHTGANAAQIADAVSAGATLSTHLGNGSHSVMPSKVNYIWEQLADDRLSAGFIADGIHLPATFLKAALRAKGPTRRFLVTDAVTPAGAEPGIYSLGDLEVQLLPGDRVVLPGTTNLAGSALRIDRGIGNLMRLAGLSLAEAVAMATVNPARALNLPEHTQGLAPEQRADVVRFDLNSEDLTLQINRTYLDGSLVYQRA